MAHPVHEASEKSPYGTLSKEEFYSKHQILHQESFIQNHQNMNIFTQSWRPAALPPSELRGVVAMVHGYTSESGWIFELTAVAIAKLGFLAAAPDLRGHGRSDGARSHLPRIEPAVSDCVQFFDSVRSAHPSLPAFLYGESLGGAIAVSIALRQQKAAAADGVDVWSGLILNGAMCGVSSKVKPMWPLEKLLPAAAFLAPRWRIVVTKPLVEKSYKEGRVRELVRRNPRRQASEHPTAASALEMERVVAEMEGRAGELEVPLLVVHGEADSVCDWESAASFCKLAGSGDKTLRILPGMWHQLIGEPEENVEVGFGVIFSWLKERTKPTKPKGGSIS